MRRVCPECGQSVRGLKDSLSHRELRGPRNITSTNMDRLFDDGGKRFLVIEEKRPTEKIPGGQHACLAALSKLPMFTVWLARGTPDELTLTDFHPSAPSEPFAERIPFETYQAYVDQWFQRALQRRTA